MTLSSTSHSAPSDQTSAAHPSVDAILSYGFRPFFLGAAVYAALAMAVWLAWIISVAAGWPSSWLPVSGSPVAWHAHEMVFGFAAAAIGGFLLTALPNWTGARPLSGAPLALMFVAWLLGRVAMGLSAVAPHLLLASVDAAFLPVLGAVAARQLFRRPALRNLVFLALVAALAICNILFHLANSGLLAADPLALVRAGVLVVIVLIAILAGRIIPIMPSFANKWFHGMPHRWLHGTALASLVAFAAIDTVGGPPALLGMAALIAAGANGVRLASWGGWGRTEPILRMLHVGYAWIVVGLLLAAVAAFSGPMSHVVVSHAFGTGAIGTMIIAVMSRASLGLTGRPIIAPRSIVWAYHLVVLAAVLRVVAPLIAPQAHTAALAAAGLAWIGAFLLFVLVYTPILTTPRVSLRAPRS